MVHTEYHAKVRRGRSTVPIEIAIRARWVESSCLRLRQMGASFRDMAEQITAAGNGDASALDDLPSPDGFTFPPGYRISPKACHKAFTKALYRTPCAEASEMRRLDLERCEEMFLALSDDIARGRVSAMLAGIRVLEHKAKLLGYHRFQSGSSIKAERDQARMIDPKAHNDSADRMRKLLKLLDRSGTHVVASSLEGEPPVKQKALDSSAIQR